MSKVIASAAEKQASPTLFDLAPVNNKRVRLDFSAPKLSAFGGLAAIREHERSGGIIDRIVSCKSRPSKRPACADGGTRTPTP